MSKQYVAEYWKREFRKIMKKKEMPLIKVIEKMNSPRSTIQNWVNLFVAKGILEERRNGKQKLVRFRR